VPCKTEKQRRRSDADVGAKPRQGRQRDKELPVDAPVQAFSLSRRPSVLSLIPEIPVSL
jgi:hypothetical protein